MQTHVLAVVLGRGGSKGLPGKNLLSLDGRPMIAHAIEHARAARRADAVCVTSDSREILAVARTYGVRVIERPAELATDVAAVDATVRQAVSEYETDGHPVTHVVILYGNVPVRPAGLIDRVVDRLIESGADSVRTLQRVTKQHPDWVHRLDGDRMVQFRANAIHRRQDLEPVFFHDGAVVAVTRQALFAPNGGDPHAFFGADRRGLVHNETVVDVDSADDLGIAEAALVHARVASPPTIAIAGRSIGPGRAPFVIAEAGVNHNGDLRAAFRLIEAAREAGADAVKFQLFSADRLAGTDAAVCDYQKTHCLAATRRGASNGAECHGSREVREGFSHQQANQREMLKRLEIPATAFKELKSFAEELGLVFLATPFGLRELEQLDKLGVAAIKIASPDLVNTPLLRNAVSSGKPLIVSTGAADLSEVDRAVMLMRAGAAQDRIALLHCVSAYPTRIQDARLACITTLAQRYRVPIGFSDHTDAVETGALAVAAGASILEKHLTLDRSASGPDHFFSLEPQSFASYVAHARTASAALGDGVVRFSSVEREVRALARGSLVLLGNIRAGEPITSKSLIVQRPGTGISPVDWDAVVGRHAARDIPGGARLTWDMVR